MNQVDTGIPWEGCSFSVGGNAAADLGTLSAPPMEKILESISDVVEIISNQGVIIYSNMQDAHMNKLGLDRVQGRQCRLVYQGVCGSCDDCPLDEVLITGKRLTKDKQIVFKNGHSAWVRQRLYPVFDDNGWVSAVLRIVFDITGEKRKELNESKYLDSLEQSLHNRIQGNPPMPVQELSAREREILSYLADGMSNREIGRLLGISFHTVKTHVVSILNKLGAKDRTQAAVTAIRLNMI